MKLLARYNRVNIAATVIVLLLSGLCYYFIIRHVLLNQLDEDLKVEEQEIMDYVKSNNSLPNPSSYKDQKVTFLASNDSPVKRTFNSTSIFSKEENENVSSRLIIFPIDVGGKNYIVSISKSEEETEDLIQLILLITLPISVWSIHDKRGFVRNIFSVITGKRSWVGYFPALEKTVRLPKIRPGVLDPVNAEHLSPVPLTVHRVNLSYAKDYRVWQDLRLVWLGFAELGG